ncbi:SDR family oxidoreductase [Lusitaniella coriacea LEGE 07157]|uniref:SDR family oxidoreductase n=1 Tax=Lusitaniella coriacea LEGE 07157 TaxID=945747 RepID=A0A8J7DXL1_9CYAN|nr:SDR family oxidoreductase [Lusitaniella coriacea]MBE9116579.1 SDR family oxidoreductase [Lusitaniella coriacea LEGE 07157]
MNRFEDKVALVTGGGSGIGRATALKFASEGASVVIGNRSEKAGQETVNLIQKAGGKASFFKTDVTQLENVQKLIKYTVDTYGGLHAAFNNAGVDDPQAMTPDQTEATFDRVMNVNVKGVWYSMKCEIEQMLNNGGGAIVNTSSIAGLTGFPGHITYTASKHAVLGLTKTAALEYAKQGIRINAVCPGAIETQMLDDLTGGDHEAREYMTSLHPIGRLGKPEEIANAVVWLCSDEASFILGQGVAVDGGFTAI